jgi:hypothetical protein
MRLILNTINLSRNLRSLLMSKNVLTLAFLALATAVFQTQAIASPYIGTGEYFVDPDGWNVGDAGSTFQAWDNVATLTNNTPDAGYAANPTIASSPTLSGSPPAFRTGSGNFYSFMGPYNALANIYNHNSGGTDGTHVIVQTAATANGTSVLPNTLEIVDLAGGAIAGGSNASALVNGDALAAGIVGSSMGDVDYEVLIWEFFLPNYTGDFRVRWTEMVDSSFDQLRVDSFITANALAPTAYTFQQIPEPSSMVISLLGLAGVLVGRRSRS